jgi:tetratricopeptide (TPR) repeat protein
MRFFFFAFVVCAAPAFADCPAPKDHSDALGVLYSEVQSAKNEGAARPYFSQMWELWADAPDEQSQAVLDRGMGKRSSYDFNGALEDFNVLVEYCPDYAEGYNQRAFVNFLQRNYVVALVDLERALERSPDHIAAQAGRALTLMELGRLDEARDQLKSALKLNPWLSERHLLNDGGRLAPIGEDI